MRDVWLGGVWLAGLLGFAGAATASKAPEMGPPPPWVLPAPAVPPEAPDAKTLPVAILLNDTQFSFDAEGWTNYNEVQVKIQSPAGLQALGALPFQWSPWSDTLVFHRAAILRDGQTINLLPKDGVFTVLRRETGLAQATLTGELTALLQPEGLEVGDVLDIAISIRHADPLLKGVPGAVFTGWDGAPIGRMRLEAHWPSPLSMNWRQSANWPRLTMTQTGGVTSVSGTFDNLRPAVLPAHAPARFQHGRQVEFSNFKDWNAVAAVMAPLYATAALLEPGSPLVAQAELIAKTSADPKVRAAGALQLVQSKVRYLAHAEADGGYTPQGADETWRLRYGDCKAKTVLLLALLHALGVEAEPVLVNTTVGDALEDHLPALLFDHVFVRARIGGRDYWLDGAREGDRNLDDLLQPAYGWVLPVTAGARLTHVDPTGPSRPQLVQIIRYDASGGVTEPEPSTFKTIFRGDLGYAFHAQLAAVPADRLDAGLKQYWANAHTAFTTAHVAAAWDPATGEETLTADGTSKLDWSGTGLELQNVGIGGKPDIQRDPQASDPDAPYRVDFPSYVETDESVVLPPGDHPSPSSAKAVDLDTVIAGVAYHRTGTIADGVFRVVASQRSLQPEISAAEARASVEPLTKLGDQGIYAPAGPQAAAANNAQAIKSQPTTADGHARRASALLDAGRFPEALAEYDAAIAIDPKMQSAWAGRAVAHAWLTDPAALADASRADTLGAPEIVAARARALLAQRQARYAEARTLFQRALTFNPRDYFSLYHLVEVDTALKDKPRALEDMAAMFKAQPEHQDVEPYLRATIEHATHDDAAAAQDAAKLPASTPEQLLARARLYRTLGKTDLAKADVDAAIKLKPTAEALVFRAGLERGAEEAAKADIDAALKLSPADLDAELWQVNTETHRQNFAEALRQMNKVVADHPEVAGNLLVGRAQIHTQLGHRAEADADFERARSEPPATAPESEVLCYAEVQAEWRPELALGDCEKAIQSDPKAIQLKFSRLALLHKLGREGEIDQAFTDADLADGSAAELNSVCWGLATRKMNLEKALRFCDASLKLSPRSAATLDSRGFVLLRLGRFEEALAAYDAALAIDAKEYNSMYGRGLAEAHLGRDAESRKDIAAALAGRPKVKDDYAKMGVN